MVALVATAGTAAADWQLDPSQSALYFASVKSDTIGEIHAFKTISGTMTKDGQVELLIDLASVETSIPIRNSRMKDMLFEVAKFPQARVSAKVDYPRFNQLGAGESLTQALSIDLELHDRRQTLQTEVQAVKLAGDRILVTAVRPILLNTGDFGLTEGVEKLRAIVQLPSISPMVPITINLVFARHTAP
ncbi:YceI family protein [Exilibacterium tricleocarpae]|nr:YceI family protein [Exilibacterium tricleocarpae]